VSRQHELRRARRREHPAFQALEVFGRDLEVLDALVDLAVGLGLERLTLVEGQQVREVVALLPDRLRDAVQVLGAREALQLRHVGTGAVRRFDRPLRVGARALRDLRDDLAGGGTVGVEVLSGLRLDPPAVDEHLLD